MCYIESFYIKVKQIYNSFADPSEKSQMVSFASSVMKNNDVFAFGYRAIYIATAFLLEQHQALAFYLNLFLSCYSNF